MPIPNLKKTMLEVYQQDVRNARPGLLTSFFKVKESYYTDSERIALDVVKSSRKIAPVVTALGGNSVKISKSIFNGIEVAPPVYSLSRPVDLYELLQREPGETEWTQAKAAWAAKVANKLRESKSDMTDMIMRSVELQAAQVLQEGKITLTDENGKDAYVLDLRKSANQMVTVTNKWDASGSDPEADLDSLAQALADEAGITATTLIFGRKAWDAFMKHDKIAKLIDKTSYDMGVFTNEVRGRGEIYKGRISLGSFTFYLYTYNASYEKFEDGSIVRYLDEKNVLMLPNEADLDFRMVHAVYPMLKSKSEFANLVPDEAIIDRVRFYNKVVDDEDTEATMMKVAARPLCLPASLDNWGVLKAVCS